MEPFEVLVETRAPVSKGLTVILLLLLVRVELLWLLLLKVEFVQVRTLLDKLTWSTESCFWNVARRDDILFDSGGLVKLFVTITESINDFCFFNWWGWCWLAVVRADVEDGLAAGHIGAFTTWGTTAIATFVEDIITLWGGGWLLYIYCVSIFYLLFKSSDGTKMRKTSQTITAINISLQFSSFSVQFTVFSNILLPFIYFFYWCTKLFSTARVQRPFDVGWAVSCYNQPPITKRV